MSGERKPTREELRLWQDVVGKPASSTGALPDSEENQALESAMKRRVKLKPAVLAPLTLTPQGIDKHAARAIRRGKLPIEDRIDLHGKTRTEAYAAVTAFLQNCAAQGMKCVLVITGKGGHVPDDAGGRVAGSQSVLRLELPNWLASPALAPAVIGSELALSKDGGAGARYVLLRKQ